MIVRRVTSDVVPAVRAFLEARLDTSIFLLACLERFGPDLGADPNSGNFRVAFAGSDIAGVFSLTKRGHLLAQTRSTDLVDLILETVAEDGIRLDGVVAEWEIASAIWTRLVARHGFRATYSKKHVVYAATMQDVPREQRDTRVRPLLSDDFLAWDSLVAASLDEEGAPIHKDVETRRGHFIRRTGLGHWWGAFDGADLVAIAGIDEAYGATGQVGGLFTRADHRGHGYGRALMATMLHEIGHRHGFERFVLFASEQNAVARAMYERFGFRAAGGFGLCFGEWPA